MRTIVIIQAIVILIGAYYIYTLSHVRDDEQNSGNDANDLSELVAPIELPSSDNEETASVPSAPAGIPEDLEGLTGNDLGMEYPILDEGVELRFDAELEVR